MYEEGRRLYTEEIKRGVRGAKAAGSVLNHTVSGQEWQNLWSGRARAARHGRCRDLRRGTRAARRRPHDGRREGGARALPDLTAVKPYDPGGPCTVEVECKISSAVDKLRRVHGVEIVDDRRIRSAETWWDAWQKFIFFPSAR